MRLLTLTCETDIFVSMKTLYLARHAKSSWKNGALSDFDRPLNKRGLRTAPFMGRLLKEQGIVLDTIISSPANRAFTTATILAEEIGFSREAIQTNERIYGAGDGELQSVVNGLNPEYDCVMLVGHNPGMHMLAQRLAGFAEDNLPTAAIVAIEFDVGSWMDISFGTGRIVGYEYPKKHEID